MSMLVKLYCSNDSLDLSQRYETLIDIFRKTGKTIATREETRWQSPKWIESPAKVMSSSNSSFDNVMHQWEEDLRNYRVTAVSQFSETIAFGLDSNLESRANLKETTTLYRMMRAAKKLRIVSSESNLRMYLRASSGVLALHYIESNGILVTDERMNTNGTGSSILPKAVHIALNSYLQTPTPEEHKLFNISDHPIQSSNVNATHPYCDDGNNWKRPVHRN
jgi:hypothetical protein